MDPINVANQVVAGVLTGLVYGLMALGLSVIFGVVRVVNFAHGEMMTIAMYATVVLFAALGLDPFLAIVPVAAAFFVFGYGLQAALINPFITRPEHSQFMLLVAVAIIMVNALLMVFGPDARNVQLDYLLESIDFGPLLLDRGKRVCRGRACVTSGAPVRLLQAHPHRHRDPRVRRQLSRREGGRAEREALYAFTFGIGAACVAVAGCMMCCSST